MKARSAEELSRAADLAKENMAQTEAATAAEDAEYVTTHLHGDVDEDKDSKRKGAPIFDVDTDRELELVNAMRENTYTRVARDADHLNQLKLKSNREHILMPTFREAFAEIGGTLNIVEDFMDQENP